MLLAFATLLKVSIIYVHESIHSLLSKTTDVVRRLLRALVEKRHNNIVSLNPGDFLCERKGPGDD